MWGVLHTYKAKLGGWLVRVYSTKQAIDNISATKPTAKQDQITVKKTRGLVRKIEISCTYFNPETVVFSVM